MTNSQLNEIKFNLIKNHKESYTRSYPAGTDIENFSIRRDKWTYQASRMGTLFHVSIQTAGEYHEITDDIFKEIEQKYFKDIQDKTAEMEAYSNEK